MIAYNLMKFALIHLKMFKEGLSESELSKRYPDRNWKEYLESHQFRDLIWEIDNAIDRGSFKFMNFYLECQHYLKEIYDLNPLFSSAFNQDTEVEDFTEEFQTSF